jgi:hypothetical protein
MWRKKANYTWFHIHTAAVSTWLYAGHVEENAFPTPKQPLRSNATSKCRLPLLQSCGSRKIAAST